MSKNIFVLGLTDFQRGHLETITNARSYRFHCLLDPELVTHPEGRTFGELLERAREELDAFDDSVDAIIAHWDFPTSVLVPILAREYGMPGPSLESVLKCEHKYWSRVEQAASVPESIPGFCSFDPFADDALEQIELDYPFWIKPIKSHSSQLGFKIERAEDFHEAIPRIREGITEIGDAFDEVLRMVDLPDEVAQATGNTCLAEEIMTGVQVAPEGTVYQGEFAVHGIFDMPKDEHGLQWERLDYPASVPDDVQKRMVDVSRRFLEHIGYDDACFNVEFLWNREADQACIIEVNTRISQSHSDLYAKVDGMSNHEVAVDLALGSRPSMPDGRGNFAVASKCVIWTDEVADGVVRSVPSEQDIARVQERFPETQVVIDVEPGDRLSELPDQSAYRYDLGELLIGADSREEIVERHRACLEMLPFEFDPIEDDEAP
jgi:biotin carboxylase